MEGYLNSLKTKYNYPDYLLIAMEKTLVAIRNYYGQSYEKLILDTIFRTRIILVDGFITEAIPSLEKTKEDLSNSFLLTSLDATYISWPIVLYTNVINNYIITGVERIILFNSNVNLDIANGLYSFVKAIVMAIRSYKNEYVIKDNTITRRSGFRSEELEILNEKELKLLKVHNTGLEESLLREDTDEIMSLILNTTYKHTLHSLLGIICQGINENLELKEEVRDCALNKAIEDFSQKYDIELGLFEEISLLADSAYQCEMLLNNDQNDITTKQYYLSEELRNHFAYCMNGMITTNQI